MHHPSLECVIFCGIHRLAAQSPVYIPCVRPLTCCLRGRRCLRRAEHCRQPRQLQQLPPVCRGTCRQNRLQLCAGACSALRCCNIMIMCMWQATA